VPHPHHCPFDPAGRTVVVPDKGLDRLFVLKLDTANGTLVPSDPPSVKVRSGAGPRHIAFNPRCLTPASSMSSTRPWPRSASRLPAGSNRSRSCRRFHPTFTADNTGAAIDVAPSGRHVYVSNRGHDQHRDLPRRRSHGAPVSRRVGADQGRDAAVHRPRPDRGAPLCRKPARRHDRGVRRRRNNRHAESHGPHRRDGHAGVRGVAVAPAPGCSGDAPGMEHAVFSPRG